jgi:hypothetical protein
MEQSSIGTASEKRYDEADMAADASIREFE